jgi:hypothetical protein
MHIWMMLATNDQYKLRYIDHLTHVANAVALLLELDEFFGRNDRHDGASKRCDMVIVRKRETNVNYQYDPR